MIPTELRPVSQGRCIVEYDDGLPYGTPKGYWLVFPDEQTSWADSKKDAEAQCKKWFKKHLTGGNMGIGTIEWRL